MAHVAFGVLEQGDILKCARKDGATITGQLLATWAHTRGIVERLAIVPLLGEDVAKGQWMPVRLATGRIAYAVHLNTLTALSREFGNSWTPIAIEGVDEKSL